MELRPGSILMTIADWLAAGSVISVIGAVVVMTILDLCNRRRQSAKDTPKVGE